MIRLIPDKSASSVNQALKSILKVYQINSITADNGTEFSCLAEVFDPENIYYAPPIHLGKGEQMKIITDSFGVGYQREVKMRLNNKSHLLKMGLITIQRNYLITNLLKSFYRLANLHLKFGIRLGKPLISRNGIFDGFWKS